MRDEGNKNNANYEWCKMLEELCIKTEQVEVRLSYNVIEKGIPNERRLNVQSSHSLPFQVTHLNLIHPKYGV